MENTINVALISEETAERIRNTEFQPGQFYNPVKDGMDRWVVSLVEAQFLPLEDFVAIKWLSPETEEIT